MTQIKVNNCYDIKNVCYYMKYWLFFSSAKNSSCNIYSEFECGNGECIDYQLTCDSIPHCKDKSDEKLLYCGKFSVFDFLISEMFAIIFIVFSKIVSIWFVCVIFLLPLINM